jgi:predicted O-methyltransferase YrrM
VDDISEQWADFDSYLVETVVDDDEALRLARTDSAAAGLPPIEVSPNQGAMLNLFAKMISARRILEIGTLGGYSTIWFARAVGADGQVVSLEIDPHHADVARSNVARAGFTDNVNVVVGAAIDSLKAMIAEGQTLFDLVFIDADKASIPSYVEAALQLTHPGSAIIVDNVVRSGGVRNAESTDPDIIGIREFLEMAGSDPRLDVTAIQTVGSKGWDGFALALVR